MNPYVSVLSVFHQSSARLCATHMGELQMEFSAQMNLLRDRVKAKRAVHTAHVFVSLYTIEVGATRGATLIMLLFVLSQLE